MINRRNLSCLMWLILAVLPAPASDGKPEPADLTKLSLEDLLRVEVTSVTRRNQALSHSAAAIYVITSEDIRRSAATTVPELLRTVPGLLVARLDGSKWSVASRGPGGRYVANLLVLVDGRTVYTPLFSGVMWEDHEFVLEDIERIEVIRGPGAVVWGSNAVSGVINIITKSARKTKGDLASVTAGDLNRSVAQARHGGDIGSSGSYRAFGRIGRYGGLVDASGMRANDGYSTNMGGFRMDLDQGSSTQWMMEGSMQTGTVRQRDFISSLDSGQTAIVGIDGAIRAGHILGRWNRTGTDGQETRVQLYYDWYDRAPFIGESRQTVDLDASRTLQLGSRHALIVGGGYRNSWDSIPTTPRVTAFPPRESVGLANVYVQDQVQLGDTTSFSVGARVEDSRLVGVSIQPAVQFLWTPTGRQSVWTSVSRALRTPSRGEQGFALLIGVLPAATAGAPFPVSVTALGQPQLGSEDLLAYEAGYRNQVSKKLSVDLAAYYYDDRQYARLPAFHGAVDPVRARSALRNGNAHGQRQAGAQLGRRGLGQLFGARALASVWLVCTDAPAAGSRRRTVERRGRQHAARFGRTAVPGGLDGQADVGHRRLLHRGPVRRRRTARGLGLFRVSGSRKSGWLRPARHQADVENFSGVGIYGRGRESARCASHRNGA